MRGRNYPNSENFVGLDASKADAISAVASSAGEIAGTIITALSTIKDAKLRREYEQRIASLNIQEQRELSAKLAKAQSDNDKRRILADSLTATSIARIQAFNKKDLNLALYLIGGVVILGSIFFIYKKFKK